MRLWLVLALVACTPEDDTPRPRPPIPVARDAAAVATDAAPPRYTGVITAAELVEIAPRVAGMIKAVPVNVGDAGYAPLFPYGYGLTY